MVANLKETGTQLDLTGVAYGATVSWEACQSACNAESACKQVVMANFLSHQEYTAHNGGATGRCLSAGTPTSPGTDYYLVDGYVRDAVLRPALRFRSAS